MYFSDLTVNIQIRFMCMMREARSEEKNIYVRESLRIPIVVTMATALHPSKTEQPENFQVDYSLTEHDNIACW